MSGLNAILYLPYEGNTAFTYNRTCFSLLPVVVLC